jgi:hypothetical protein
MRVEDVGSVGKKEVNEKMNCRTGVKDGADSMEDDSIRDHALREKRHQPTT